MVSNCQKSRSVSSMTSPRNHDLLIKFSILLSQRQLQTLKSSFTLIFTIEKLDSKKDLPGKPSTITLLATKSFSILLSKP